MEFKVGDKLRYIGGNNDFYARGGVFEITDFDGGNKLYTVQGKQGADLWHSNDITEWFEHINKPRQPQVTKVKLTQEQAKALEIELTSFHNNVAEFLEIHAQIVNCEENHYTSEVGALNELSVADLARALLIGYDVEQTREEKLAEYYQERKKWAQQALERDERHSYAINAARAQAVNATLSILGIKVKGIND